MFNLKMMKNDLLSLNRWLILFIVLGGVFLTVQPFIEFIPGNGTDFANTQNSVQKIFLVLSSIAAFTNILCVVLVSLGKLSNFAWGVVGVLTYGLFAFSAGYSGDGLLNLFFYLPLNIYGYFVWKRDMNKDTDEVVVNTMKLNDYIITIVSGLVLFGTFYLIIPPVDVWFQNMLDVGWGEYWFADELGAHILDAFTTAFSIVAMVLMLKKFSNQWLLWILINTAALIMWGFYVPNVDGGNINWGMMIMWSVFLINSIYGYYKWIMRSKISVYS